MRMKRAAHCLLVVALCLTGSVAHAQEADKDSKRQAGPLDCTAPDDVTQFKATLPNTARAIRQREDLTIVAIGSSSTEGVGASDRSLAYPAQLAKALRLRWPDLKIRVINKGIGGEDARQMLRRFEEDVLPYKPQLVVWQVGSNYTLRSRDMDAYAAILRKGINQLKAAKTDVILMDLQYAPQVLDKRVHLRMIATMGALANDLKVAVFRRFAIMRHWVSSGKYRMEDIVAKDRLHMNDTSYGCIGKLLALSVSTAARIVQTAPPEGSGRLRNVGQ